MDEEFSILPTPQAYATAEQTAKARKIAQLLMGGPSQMQAHGGNAISGIADALKQSDGEDEDSGMSAYSSTGNVAAAAPKIGMPPIPGSPVTHAPMEGQASGDTLPSSALPFRMKMSKEGIVNTLASTRLDPATKQAALQVYMEQNQPIEIKTPGGRRLIGSDGSQLEMPELYQNPMESEGTRMTVGHTFKWDPKTGTVTQHFAPTGTGHGPLGTFPPAASTQAQNENPAIPQQMQILRNFGLDTQQKKESQKLGLEQLHKDYEKTAMIGQKAQESIPHLMQMRQMIEDKNLYQGLFAAGVLDWNRLKAAAGSKDGERAAALMQAFEKMRSGQIIKDLGTQFTGLGQIRVKEMELAEKAFANIYNSKEANRAVLEIAIKSNKQLSDLAELTSKYMQGYQFDKNGNDVLGKDGASIIGDPAKATAAGLQKLKLDWLKAHPIYGPGEIERYHEKFNDDPRYPAPPPPKKGGTRAVAPALANQPPAWGGGGNTLPPGWTRE